MLEPGSNLHPLEDESDSGLSTDTAYYVDHHAEIDDFGVACLAHSTPYPEHVGSKSKQEAFEAILVSLREDTTQQEPTYGRRVSGGVMMRLDPSAGDEGRVGWLKEQRKLREERNYVLKRRGSHLRAFLLEGQDMGFNKKWLIDKVRHDSREEDNLKLHSVGHARLEVCIVINLGISASYIE